MGPSTCGRYSLSHRYHRGSHGSVAPRRFGTPLRWCERTTDPWPLNAGICRKQVLTGEVHAVSTSSTLCSEPELPLDETDLPDDIALCQPTHLSLADHVNRLIALREAHDAFAY